MGPDLPPGQDEQPAAEESIPEPAPEPSLGRQMSQGKETKQEDKDRIHFFEVTDRYR